MFYNNYIKKNIINIFAQFIEGTGNYSAKALISFYKFTISGISY